MTFLASPRRYTGQPASRAGRVKPASLTDEQLAGSVMSPLATCSGAVMDPDDWFPVAAVATAARAEAGRALTLCGKCPVRAECLELSLRQWGTIGKYGIWGGLVEAERAAARREWLAGAEVTALLRPAGRDSGDSPGSASAPADPGAAEPVPITGVTGVTGMNGAAGLDGSPRTPPQPPPTAPSPSTAGACSAGKRKGGRGPRGAGVRPRPLVEQ
jgi:WhiB family redox-sensing transcriptional regulator